MPYMLGLSDIDEHTLPAPVQAVLERMRQRIEQQTHEIASKDHDIASKGREIERKDREIAWRDARLQKIHIELARLKRWKFGAKTEAMTAQQRALFAQTLAEDEADLQAQLAALQARLPQMPAAPKDAPRRPRRQALPEHLQRVEHRHEPDDTTCPNADCGAPMQRVGEDVSERLDIIPAQFFVHRHVYGKWACRCCQQLVQQPAEPDVVDGGIPASGLVAHTLISRFADHLPYYRQEAINARSGVHTPRSTLAAWAGAGGAALQPLYEAHKRFVLDATVLHADETPIPLLDPGRGKTKKAYVWAYARSLLDGPPGVIYEFLQRPRSAVPAGLPGRTAAAVRRAGLVRHAGVRPVLGLRPGARCRGRPPGRGLRSARQAQVRGADAAQRRGQPCGAGGVAALGADLSRGGAVRGHGAAGPSGWAAAVEQTAVGRTARVAAARTRPGRRWRHRAGHRLQPEPLGATDAASGRRPRAHRQQPPRAADQAMEARRE